jgi:thiosulfate dehydrogenase [quinone] large subunit
MQLPMKKRGVWNVREWSNLPAWTILPLRGFLGITFVYAGLQKITNPQFFNDASHGSIKYQLEIFSHSSPIRWLLINLAIPHADFFGWLVALGELLVGIATLLGLFSRLTAGGGFFISGLLWLTATWNVEPYFLGPDSIYAMAWLTLLLTGMGDYSADQWLMARRAQDDAAMLAVQRRARQRPQYQQRGQAVNPLEAKPRRSADVQRRALLRNLIAGSAVLATGMVGALFAYLIEPVLQDLKRSFREYVERRTTTGSVQASNPTPPPGTPAGAIGNTSQIPINNALTFTLASNGDPGIVIHLSGTKFVAYDATCTHAGCTVNYDPATQALICPCHGAAFDPANNAAVLAGPTNQPLASIPIRIDSSGNIYVSG